MNFSDADIVRILGSVLPDATIIYRDDNFLLIRWKPRGSWGGPDYGILAPQPVVTRYELKDLRPYLMNSVPFSEVSSEQVWDGSVEGDGPLTLMKQKQLIHDQRLKKR